MIDSPWAVLLCKFSQDNSQTLPVSHYKDLFTGQGSGTFNMTDFFSDMSHGLLDLTKSKVFGWFSIPIKNKAEYDSFDAQNAVDPTIPKSRPHLIDVVQKTAASQNIDLNKFFGLVICMNGPMDVFGGGGVAAFDSVWGLRPSIIGQEMGHGYGLDHSRIDGSTADYMDPWDVMSTDSTPYEQPNADYGSIGPGLNAWNMRSRDWLDESRVCAAAAETTIDLRPLHRRDLPGFLAADLCGEFLVEYRKKERWDGGFAHSAVFVHRFEDNHSYVMRGTNGNPDLVDGDVFQIGDPDNLLSAFRRVEVVSIDDATSTATIKIACHDKADPLHGRDWAIGGTLFGGVASGGGGGIIVNGHFHPVPPRDPLRAILEQLAAYRTAAAIKDTAVQQAARRSALQTISKRIAGLGASLDPFRVPAKGQQSVQAGARAKGKRKGK